MTYQDFDQQERSFTGYSFRALGYMLCGSADLSVLVSSLSAELRASGAVICLLLGAPGRLCHSCSIYDIEAL